MEINLPEADWSPDPGDGAAHTTNDGDGRGTPVMAADRTPIFLPSISLQPPKLITIGSVVPDFRAAVTRHHAGNKHDAVIDVSLGGSAINAGAFGPVNGIPTAAISVQKKGLWSGICHGLSAKKGVRLFLQERVTGPAVSLITPNREPGQYNIHTQRMAPPTVGELTLEISFEVALFSTCVGSQGGASSFLRIWAKWW
jgi:hypothetical protein